MKASEKKQGGLTDAECLHWLAMVSLRLDDIGGIDLHERAYSHFLNRRGDEHGEKEPSEADYTAAIRDGIEEAIYGEEE